MEQKASDGDQTQVLNRAMNTIGIGGDGEAKPIPVPPPRPKKKRGPMHIIKVALFMMRSRSEAKPTPIPINSGSNNNLWKKLVGSVRPLYLEQQRDSSSSSSPSSSPKPKPKLKLKLRSKSKPKPDLNSPVHLFIDTSPSRRTDFSEDTMFSPSASSSHSGPDSRYASAVGLNEMVLPDDNDGPEPTEEKAHDGVAEEDNAIDAKADEFIANFYNQIKLQRMNTLDYYRERRQRSLG